jgi:peptidylprolyl isomerase
MALSLLPTLGLAIGLLQSPGLKVEDVKVGQGRAVVRGDQIWVDYSGSLPDGNVFDATKGDPFNTVIGVGTVIPGWEKGIIGMKVGGVRKLTIPPEMAYGSRGIGPIPPNATLNFTITLTKLADPRTRLKISVDKAGSGVGTKWDETVTFHEIGLVEGKEFMNTQKFQGPITATVGKDHLPIGMTLGLLGMKVGETRTITVPPDLAYGQRGAQGVPPNSTVVFKLTRIVLPPVKATIKNS